MEIRNVDVFGISGSVRASKFPMQTDVEKCFYAITDMTRKLGSAGIGSGHDNFLNGCIVQFDLTFSLKAWTELQRYHFMDFVSSQSTMHCITKFDITEQCNEYVLPESIAIAKALVEVYNIKPTEENYLKVLYNIPTGFQLTARMTTNYRQLKTIYYQRRNHRLPEWRKFCDWILTLPYFKELCIKEEEE